MGSMPFAGRDSKGSLNCRSPSMNCGGALFAIALTPGTRGNEERSREPGEIVALFQSEAVEALSEFSSVLGGFPEFSSEKLSGGRWRRRLSGRCPLGWRNFLTVDIPR